jgi:hypothetical protein
VIGLLWFALAILVSPCRSNARLEAENAVLRHQLLVLRRKCRRVRLTNFDRWIFVQIYRLFPSLLQVLHIIRPETLVRWHRAGFRSYWRWKSRNRGGRPQIDTDLRTLIRQMSHDNPLWGAPRIHGELLKLGFEVAQSTVAKYMLKPQGAPPGQSWWTFLRNHMPEIAAMDLFVVPTLAFGLLYGFIIVRLDRRQLVWIGVTSHPTADWIARQITEAFPWDSAPGYLIRDRDRAFGSIVRQRLRAMGIRDKPIAAHWPWQNGFAERLIGSIAENVSTTSLFSARSICAACCVPTPATITEAAPTGRSTKTRPCTAQLSAQAACSHIPFWAGFITSTSDSSFRYTQRLPPPRANSSI